jgi:chaperonin cofactor prefoldin
MTIKEAEEILDSLLERAEILGTTLTVLSEAIDAIEEKLDALM